MPRTANRTSFKKGKSGNPSGRTKGLKNKVELSILDDLVAKVRRGEAVSPLHHMLAVLCDPKSSKSRKDAAARHAAPYIHRKMPLAIDGGEGADGKGKPVAVVDAAKFAALTPAQAKQVLAVFDLLGLGLPAQDEG